GAVIDRSSDDRKANRNVHPVLDPHDLDRAVALVMIHRYHEVEVAAVGAEEKCIGRQGTIHVPAPSTGLGHGWFDLFALFATPEQPVLAGMRVDPANADPWFSPDHCQDRLPP